MKGPALTTAAQVRRRLATDESGSSAAADPSAAPDPRLVVLDERYEQTRDVLATSWRATRPRNEVDGLVRAFESAWVTLRARLIAEKTQPAA